MNNHLNTPTELTDYIRTLVLEKRLPTPMDVNVTVGAWSCQGVWDVVRCGGEWSAAQSVPVYSSKISYPVQ